MKEPRKPPEQERLRGAVAFVLAFMLVMFLGVSVLVGAFDFDPRRSALLALAL